MSKKSRTLKRARAQLRSGQPAVTKVKDPGEILSMIPFMLGFDPYESLVVIALEGPRRRFGPCCRIDLVDDPDDVSLQASYLVDLVEHHGFGPVIIAVYSDRPAVADPVMADLLTRLEGRGVEVIEALRADGARWWSYVCKDPRCCSPGGTPYDVGTSRVAVEAVVAGMSRAPDRETLREQFEAVPERQAALVEALASLEGQPPLGCDDVVPTVKGWLGRAEEISMDEASALVLAVQDVGIRDRAWSAMTRANAPDHLALWRHVMQCSPEPLMAPVGALAAFAAWLSGRGVLASHAAERVLVVHPDYSMARLVLGLCERSVNPSVWSGFPSPSASSSRRALPPA